MSLQTLLERYEHLAGQILELLQKERSALKAGNPAIFEQTADYRKRLINELTEAVRALKAEDPSVTPRRFSKSLLIQNIQNKFTKILKLDREVERLYLAGSRLQARDGFNPGLRKIQEVYGSGSSGEIF